MHWFCLLAGGATSPRLRAQYNKKKQPKAVGMVESRGRPVGRSVEGQVAQYDCGSPQTCAWDEQGVQFATRRHSKNKYTSKTDLTPAQQRHKKHVLALLFASVCVLMPQGRWGSRASKSSPDSCSSLQLDSQPHMALDSGNEGNAGNAWSCVRDQFLLWFPRLAVSRLTVQTIPKPRV